jgi:dUTP pyrophosphatase
MSDFFDEAYDFLKKEYRDFTILNIAVDFSDHELNQLYKDQTKQHNQNIINNLYSNAGFDLFVPNDVIIKPNDVTMVNMNVKCEMMTSNKIPCAFYMYPRSSISKTPLMLANSVGIIDSGYRGNLIGAFRSFSFVNEYMINKHNRLLQITNPTLTPIVVKMVNENDLSSTERGSGGFGSTGI